MSLSKYTSWAFLIVGALVLLGMATTQLSVSDLRPMPALTPLGHTGDRLEPRLAHYIARQYQVSLAQANRVVHAARQAAKRTGVPLSLVLAVAAIESSFNPKVSSSVGAVGLMQVKPVMHRDVLPAGEELNVESNVTAGAYILSGYLSRDGDDVVNALQRYNGNRGDRQARYAHKVLSKMVEFEAAGAGVLHEQTS